MSSKQGSNAGVIRTKKALKHAFLSLLAEKELKAITITEVVARAEYTRGTFYNHYHYLEDLLEEIIEETIQGFIHAFREPYEGKKEHYSLQQLSHSTVPIFRYIGEHAETFALLFQMPGFQSRLSDAIRTIYDRDYELLFAKVPSHINREIFMNQSVYIIIGLISYWIQSQYKYSAKYMTEQMLEIAKLYIT